MSFIDLRSDTVTQPTEAMRKVMATAKVGDDEYREDPSVIALEQLAAEKLGTEAALFTSSGTQSNLIAILTHCQRGDEYILGNESHIFKREGGGPSVLGGIQPMPLEFCSDGTMKLDEIENAVKQMETHLLRTRLLCLENTETGKPVPIDFQSNAQKLAKKHGFKTHLDGARLFNAAVKMEIPVINISKFYDSIAICLSKGLGAPVGSVLCSTREFIQKARRWRKILGGGMRQAGIIAAAGVYALENNIERLAEDHYNAEILTEGLQQIEEINIGEYSAQTNMVFLSMDHMLSLNIKKDLIQQGIKLNIGGRMRMVTHLNISRKDVLKVIESLKTSIFKNKPAGSLSN
jgi:threonine aldolase